METTVYISYTNHTLRVTMSENCVCKIAEKVGHVSS